MVADPIRYDFTNFSSLSIQTQFEMFQYGQLADFGYYYDGRQNRTVPFGYELFAAEQPSSHGVDGLRMTVFRNTTTGQHVVRKIPTWGIVVIEKSKLRSICTSSRST